MLLLFSTPLWTSCRTGQETSRSLRTGERSVKPGINDELLEGDIEKWRTRFEGESREIYRERRRIADAVGAGSGMVVADIGAGTGFIAELLAERVGPEGAVFAVDIVPSFLELIISRASEKGINNVVPVLCAEDSVSLPPASIDVALLCDTYHHFEYPRSTMATIHRAIKPGGRLVVVDFIREEGLSRDWIIRHVRAGKEVFAREIESDGFELIDYGEGDSFLKEAYIMRFRRTP